MPLVDYYSIRMTSDQRFLAKAKDESTASRCYECATESGLPTLCSAENEKGPYLNDVRKIFGFLDPLPPTMSRTEIS